MPVILIDNQRFEVEPGHNLLQACLSLGFNLPYFCWHPALNSVGACRQCAVKQFRDEKDTRGRLVMACMTPAEDGTRISIEDPEARAFRSCITEWMMINHPHDCPVCDEGGECHLQDMVVMTGHSYRRYRGHKRTFWNQDLGPFVNHEMNRCIQCYRCVRFYRDYAGGRDFDAYRLRNQVYFGRQTDGTLESEFSGNLVEICPTGVFTDKSFKSHYTRKWDLQTAPSICVHCALGCNTIPGERYGVLRRIRNRYHGDINGYFLCDRGRYGYEFVNSDRRIRSPLMRSRPNDPPDTARKDTALGQIGQMLSSDAKVIGIGSPRASLEANYALWTLVGPERFYLGVSDAEHRAITTVLEMLRNGPARTPTLQEASLADAVLILGEDVTNVAPMLALALRQSVRRQPMEIAHKLRISEWDDQNVREVVQDVKGPLFIASLCATRLDDVATETYHAAPADLARLALAVAGILRGDEGSIPDLPDTAGSLAGRIASALRGAKRPLVVSGTSLLSEEIIRAAAAVAWALCRQGSDARLGYTVPECNSLGLALIGGGSLDDAFRAVQDGTADTVVILENDLYRRATSAAVNQLFESAKHVIVIDSLATPTTGKADVVLPAATFAEGDGTLVNNEGRAQRFYQVFVPSGEIQESWRWLRDVRAASGRGTSDVWQNLDDITTAMSRDLPILSLVTEIAPPATFRIDGEKIPRQPARFSGRTAMHANVSVHEPKPPDDPDSALAFSMEGYPGQPPPPLIPRFWAPGWNSIQSLNKFQEEVGGPLRGGNPGRRLIEPAGDTKEFTIAAAPPFFARRSGEWLIVPLYHIFGSEELSVLSPGIASLTPRPYIGLNPDDAAEIGVSGAREVELVVDDVIYHLPVMLIPSLPTGVAGLPMGIPGVPWVALPGWYSLKPARPGEHVP